MFTISLQNDDVQDFDAIWDQAQISVSEMPSDGILEGLYKSKLQNSVLRTVMTLYDQESARNNGTPNYQQLKTSVKLHTDQMMRTRNFKVRNDVVERGPVTPRVKKERKPTLRGKWESVFSGRHMDNVRKETHAVSVMTQWPLETVALAKDEKD